MKKKLILLLDKLSTQPLWLKLIISTVVLILVVLLGYSTIVSMRYQERTNAFALEEQYKSELIRNIARSKSLPVLQQQVEILKNKFNASLQALPTDSARLSHLKIQIYIDCIKVNNGYLLL